MCVCVCMKNSRVCNHRQSCLKKAVILCMCMHICANTHKRVLNSKHKRAPAFVRGGGSFKPKTDMTTLHYLSQQINEQPNHKQKNSILKTKSQATSGCQPFRYHTSAYTVSELWLSLLLHLKKSTTVSQDSCPVRLRFPVTVS